jgi:hypothetical protein
MSDLSVLVRDALIHPYGGAGSVPGSRQVITTLPLLVNGVGSATLAADITLSMQVSPAGNTVVSTGRLLSGTAPIKINAGASATLAADVVISCDIFAGGAAGLVPTGSGGNAGLFLSGAGTWLAGAIAGVASITATAPLIASAATGAVTLSAALFTTVSSGLVPPSGGGTANFLRADGTFAPPVFGNAIRLQATHPGATDSGSGHIDGWFQADTAFTNSSNLSTRGATTFGVIQLEDTIGGALDIEAYNSTTTLAPGMTFRRGRGTALALASCSAGDWLAQISVGGIGTDASSHTNIQALLVLADVPLTAEVPIATRLKGGPFNDAISHHLWLTQAGTVLGRSLGTSIPTPTADIELRGSVAFKTVSKTANYTILARDTCVLVDASSADVAITLPSAAASAGRLLVIMRTDSGANAHFVSFVGTISGKVNPDLKVMESIWIQSDGTNWFVVGGKFEGAVDVNGNFSSNVTGVALTAFDQFITLPYLATSGDYLIEIFAAGDYSSNGSGTNQLNLLVRDKTNGRTFATSRTQTVTNGVSSESWTAHVVLRFRPATNSVMIRGEITLYDVGGGDKRMAMTPTTQVLNSGPFDLGLAAQWNNANAGNLIRQTYIAIRQTPLTQYP